MQIDNGLLDCARQVTSPNCDARPAGVPVDLLVIHAISLPPGEFGGDYIDALFTNQLDPQAHDYFQEIQALRVSSHVLIRRDGELVQYVPFDQRAWHAGVSTFAGRECCNDFSIGIELEGADDIAYTPVQYEQLADVIACLMQAYPAISTERIAGHCDIAPGRKTDPGESFDWRRLHGLLRVHGL
ncbi:1,6-anhydro-N-acetylmuramyl-L-alanine amidase AmpD [Sulfuriflexus mobilis]|uniref:1,6-anhydro-N-acetylmuramyl-L-alanine amidase AmpD n=1 Tax=Sulfuriflexus mobilis TaxID=1811807 RepID=UPI000F8309F3|nr:1,6-anhydro-N-acetylmuramyl-L-alanine amidase AmpD [Sulfuriflexus mobilis]